MPQHDVVDIISLFSIEWNSNTFRNYSYNRTHNTQTYTYKNNKFVWENILNRIIWYCWVCISWYKHNIVAFAARNAVIITFDVVLLVLQSQDFPIYQMHKKCKNSMSLLNCAIITLLFVVVVFKYDTIAITICARIVLWMSECVCVCTGKGFLIFLIANREIYICQLHDNKVRKQKNIENEQTRKKNIISFDCHSNNIKKYFSLVRYSFWKTFPVENGTTCVNVCRTTS